MEDFDKMTKEELKNLLIQERKKNAQLRQQIKRAQEHSAFIVKFTFFFRLFNFPSELILLVERSGS